MVPGVRGSERVLEGIREVFPGADLFALGHFPEDLEGTSLEGVEVRTSFLQSLPGARKRYMFFLPLAVEQFDLRPYDLVISSSHVVAKGS